MSTEKWTADDVPDQTGRVAVVTGANTGLGFETAKVLAERGATVVITARDEKKGAAAAKKLSAAGDVSVQALDLASLDSVRTAADELKAAHPQIDLLVNNAGVMYPPKQTTADGFELQFGTNHLGHFAWTGQLTDTLTAGSRVVVLGSIAHRIRADIHFDDLQWEKSYDRVAAYGQSKLANVMFAYALQRRFTKAGADTIAVAAHPGISNTELLRHIPGSSLPGVDKLVNLVTNSPAVGALATLRAATTPDADGGEYYGPSGFQELLGHPVRVESNPKSHDEDIQERLWAVSEELTGVTFSV